ncbi:hypothetical protein AJ79_09156 [Helicocarpus griseus UAMH5409]|uniref:Uncharacterized protein n=1 Tax=Helicocarpus griseus UAMH5409 TaxID=1447875 RepID=A0A2B7WM01_9EURO|nr:hypothetical protein AJ79_09156 [Helicocarpus griseus UAMH5409]
MSAPHAGRQSPSPSRQTGPQESDVPGWTGQASKSTSHEGNHVMNNFAANKGGAAGGRGAAERGSGGVPGAGVDEQGNVKLESNPVHPLEHEAEAKVTKGVVGMKE